MSRSDPVVVEVTVAAPVDVVWQALRDPAHLRRWFGWDYEGLGPEIDGIFVAGATIDENDRTLDTGEGRFELHARGEATVVRLTRAAPGGRTSWDGIYDDINEGWITFVHQLRYSLERHPGEDRRTLRLAGDADVDPVEALGLGDLPDEGRYEVGCATGETLTGEVWFRSRDQLGLTVEGWGEGLLVVTGTWSDRGGGAILTTYGLDDEAFEAVAHRWTRWWQGRYRRVEAQRR